MNRTGSPLRLRSRFRSVPSTRPKATCSARAGSSSQPAMAATAKTIAKMLRLPGIDDVQEAGRADPLDPVEHACKVAGAVGEGARPAADDQRQRVALSVGEPWREHDLSAVGLLEQAGPIEPFDDLGHQRLVAALPRQVVVGQQNAELGVDVVPVRGALGDEQAPQPQRFLVALLQQHDPLPGPLGETPRPARSLVVAAL